MHYFLDHYGNQLAAFVLISCGSLVVAVIAGRGAKRNGEVVATKVARVGAVGLASAAVAATTMNGVGSGGGFQWTVGEAGLSAWSADLARFPETVQSVLLVGNVAVYVPLGVCLAIGWPSARSERSLWRPWCPSRWNCCSRSPCGESGRRTTSS